LTGKQALAYGGRVVDVYKAIADETRRILLDELMERDEQTLFELCSKLAMKHDLTPSRQAVSQHLDVLEQAGLVHSERRGRYRLHSIDTTPLSQISERWPARPASPPSPSSQRPSP
jgi:DNA-binding transcriptional ArsR family regulator